MAGGPGDTKVCASCGREFGWRAKWAKDWDDVRYCSEACRRRGVTKADTALETTILELLDKRAASATICPSDAARTADPEHWRDRMEDARRAARRLVDRGEVEITQGGRVVDPSTAKGPIRIRKVRHG